MGIVRIAIAIVLGFLCLAQVQPSLAQALEDRAYRIEFQRGQSSATIRDSLTGGERVVYRFAVRAGQELDIKLSSTTRLAEFLLYAPGTWPNGRPTASGSILGALVPELNRYTGRASANGDYRVVVRHLRDVPTVGLVSNFRLDLTITGSGDNGGVATQLPGEAPTAGEPAYWKVSGLAAGDTLNVRVGPGTSFRVVDRLSTGEIVKNEGCASASGARWCEVSRPGKPRESGWVTARYLVSSAAPKPSAGQGATQLPGDALVGGTGFNATGKLPCKFTNLAKCDFGVIRRGRGNASLYIDLPSGVQRRIEFEGGRPVSSNAQGGIYGEWTNTGAVTVFIGPTERYTIDEAILFGG